MLVAGNPATGQVLPGRSFGKTFLRLEERPDNSTPNSHCNEMRSAVIAA